MYAVSEDEGLRQPATMSLSYGKHVHVVGGPTDRPQNDRGNCGNTYGGTWHELIQDVVIFQSISQTTWIHINIKRKA